MSAQRDAVHVRHSPAASAHPRRPVTPAAPPPAAGDPWDVLLGELGDGGAEFIDLSAMLIALLDR